MNRFNDICRLIDSIFDQAFYDLEVIFVADQLEQLASSVEDYVRKKEPSFMFRVLVNKGNSGVNVCRNIAIKECTSEIIGIVDDDIVLFPDWINQTLEDFKDETVVGITGPAYPLWEDPQLMSWFPKELYFVWGATVWDWSSKREIRNVGGMNCSFRKKALFKVGLYKIGIGPITGEEKISWFYPSGEEIDLSLRVREAFPSLKIIYDPNVKIYHKAEKKRFNLQFILKRTFRFGYTRNYIGHQFTHSNDKSLLSLEQNHLKTMISSSTGALKVDLRSRPLTALNRFAMTWVGTLSVALGYVAYFVYPYPSPNNRIPRGNTNEFPSLKPIEL